MRRISDYLATLTAAELEQFREAIEDSLQREPAIQESVRREEAALAELAERQRLLMATIWELDHTGQRPSDSVRLGALTSMPLRSRMN
jgi:hypothetical protein